MASSSLIPQDIWLDLSWNHLISFLCLWFDWLIYDVVVGKNMHQVFSIQVQLDWLEKIEEIDRWLVLVDIAPAIEKGPRGIRPQIGHPLQIVFQYTRKIEHEILHIFVDLFCFHWMQKKNFQGWRILSDISVLSLLCDKYETEDFFFINEIWKLIRQVDTGFHALQNGIFIIIIFECALLSQTDQILVWAYDIPEFSSFSRVKFYWKNQRGHQSLYD